MANIIKVAGIDPALSNFGMVRADFDLATGCVRIESVRLVQTVKDGSKQVRKGSDDLRRCREIVEAMRDFLDGVTLGFAEVPSGGAKSANALKALSMATALLGAGVGEGLALAQRQALEALWLLRRGDALVEVGTGRFAPAAPAAPAP